MIRKTQLYCIIALIFVNSLIFTGCGQKKLPEEKIAEKMLRKHKEKQLLPLIENYYKVFMDFDCEDIYVIDKNGWYNLSEKFISEIKPVVKEIREFHNQYHSNEIIPRDSEEWNNWMGCEKFIDYEYETIVNSIEYDLFVNNKKIQNRKSVTFCPYCLAIERAKKEKEISNDYLPEYQETYLYKSPKFLKSFFFGLESISKENELRTIIKEKLYPIMDGGNMFSLEHTDYTWGNYKGKSGDLYYINLTPEYKNVILEIFNFHKEHHNQICKEDFDNIWMYEKRKQNQFLPSKTNKEDWWQTDNDKVDDNDFIRCIKGGNITACPFCILEDDQNQNKEGITKNGYAYEDMYTFSVQVMDRFYKFVNKMEEIKNAIPIRDVGDAIKKNEITGIRTWNYRSGTFYGTIVSLSESDSYYDGFQMIYDPVYNIDVIAESGFYPNCAHLRFLKSKIPYTVIEKLKNSDVLYFKGKLDIDSMGGIEVINAELIDRNLVQAVKESKRKSNEDDLVRALANLFAGGTQLSASDFE